MLGLIKCNAYLPDGSTFSQVYERYHEEHKRKILRSDYQATSLPWKCSAKANPTCNKLRVLLGQLVRWVKEEGITLTDPAENLVEVIYLDT